jgi:hypothetical protein
MVTNLFLLTENNGQSIGKIIKRKKDKQVHIKSEISEIILAIFIGVCKYN